MFAVVQPPFKLSFFPLTPKKGTSSWGLVKFFPWKGKEGRGQASHFWGEGSGQELAAHFGEKEGDKSMQLVFREGVPPSLSLSLLHLYPLLKAKKRVFGCWTKVVLIPLLGYP
jgi:hypothetical protein